MFVIETLLLMHLISGIANSILIDQNLIVAGKCRLEHSCGTCSEIVDDGEDITGVGVGSTEYGCLIGILINLHVNANQESTGVLS